VPRSERDRIIEEVIATEHFWLVASVRLDLCGEAGPAKRACGLAFGGFRAVSADGARSDLLGFPACKVDAGALFAVVAFSSPLRPRRPAA
jgi:hypothetical protein